mmetsp:Transcript_33788/g.74863  ORF Transcript_33788/g.74863 Transcript_33788/m.74863 type:complete len:266 (+) Transcript_33788:829-1626(+)
MLPPHRYGLRQSKPCNRLHQLDRLMPCVNGVVSEALSPPAPEPPCTGAPSDTPKAPISGAAACGGSGGSGDTGSGGGCSGTGVLLAPAAAGTTSLTAAAPAAAAPRVLPPSTAASSILSKGPSSARLLPLEGAGGGIDIQCALPPPCPAPLVSSEGPPALLPAPVPAPAPPAPGARRLPARVSPRKNSCWSSSLSSSSSMKCLVALIGFLRKLMAPSARVLAPSLNLAACMLSVRFMDWMMRPFSMSTAMRSICSLRWCSSSFLF